MILCGDSREVLKGLPDSCVSSVVTDPPYELEFMGKAWDSTGVAYDVDLWKQALRLLKPGGHLLAFGGARTYHRLACAVEDSGFEIRDQIMWLYGQGFPKSLDVSKAIDKRGGRPDLAIEIGAAIKKARESRGLSVSDCDRRYCEGSTNWTWFEGRPTGQRAPTPATFAAIVSAWPELQSLAALVDEAARDVIGQSDHASGIGNSVEGHYTVGGTVAEKFDITAPATDAARQWEGWGTTLKPAHEPIVVARKPLVGTVAANVLEHGTGALNVDGCRVAGPKPDTTRGAGGQHGITSPRGAQGRILDDGRGRWPANVVHDGSDEAVAGFPESVDGGSSRNPNGDNSNVFGPKGPNPGGGRVPSSGSTARFFYCAKPSKAERMSMNKHPTVKPLKLMRWLVRLVTPPNGLVLDPFLGSGTTGIACEIEGFPWIGIEQDPSTAAMAQARIARDDGAVAESKMNGSAPPTQLRPIEGPLFEGMV